MNFNVDAYPDRTFHGSVTQVRNRPTTVNNVVTYDSVVGVNNSGLQTEARHDGERCPSSSPNDENVLKIPNAALRFRPPDTWPWC